MVECADGSLYTGITNDLSRRIGAHNSGDGAKYTRSRRPVTLVYTECCEDRGAALRREYQIKQLDVSAKHGLIQRNRQN